MKTSALLVLSATLQCVAQTSFAATPATISDSKAEALVVCSEDLHSSSDLTPYGFAKATLVSLWYARNAAERGNEIQQAGEEADNFFPFMTAMMRITKTSTNDFICAKRPLKPFTAAKQDEQVKTAADFMMVVYDAHITINERLIQLLKKLDNTNMADVIDQISTFQVERSQRWADLVDGALLASSRMVDVKRTDDPGKTTRVVITKAQKQSLLDWFNEHFPEFKHGTPKDQWSYPAVTAKMFFKIFDGRKCSDE